MDDFVIKEIEGDKSLKTNIEEGLSQIERAIMTDIDVMSDRVAIFEALKHLIVAGNVLLFVGENGIRVFPLSRYVVKRDPSGNVWKLSLRNASPNTSEEIRKKLLKT